MLQGGCGLGDKVHSLDKVGFEAYGIDFAPNVVSMINENWPHLDVRQGDVRKLPFEDDFFDGYWSFGVIEHFFIGFDEILEEMARVIKPGGYLFLDQYLPDLREQLISKFGADLIESHMSMALSALKP